MSGAKSKNEASSSRTYEEIIINYMDNDREQTRPENRNHYRLSSSSSSNQMCTKSNFRRSQSSSSSGSSRHKVSARNRHSSTGGVVLESEKANNQDLSSNLGNRSSNRKLRRNRNRHSPPTLIPVPNLIEADQISQLNPTKETHPQNPQPQANEYEEVTKKIYKWKLGKAFHIPVPFDHYFLISMFDRNKCFIELFFSILVSVLVSVFASLVIYEQIYDDLFLVVFCFIVASCHYSLLKSVQPDSSSPIHGFNSLTALSRPIYFCIICSATLLLRRLSASDHQLAESLLQFFQKFTLYGFQLR